MPNFERPRYSDHAENVRAGGWLDALTELIVQRLALAEDVAAGKFAEGQPIDDPIREQGILDSIARVIQDTGSRQEKVMQFFRDQIEANKVIQRALHERWYAHPEELPPVQRDLAAEIRPELDRITMRMLGQLAHMNESPSLGREGVKDLLGRQLTAGPSARYFSELRWDAAFIALQSFMTNRQ